MILSDFNAGLGSIPLLSNAKTRSISAENPNGEKGGGAKGWVVNRIRTSALRNRGDRCRPQGFLRLVLLEECVWSLRVDQILMGQGA